MFGCRIAFRWHAQESGAGHRCVSALYPGFLPYSTPHTSCMQEGYLQSLVRNKLQEHAPRLRQLFRKAGASSCSQICANDFSAAVASLNMTVEPTQVGLSLGLFHTPWWRRCYVCREPVADALGLNHVGQSMHECVCLWRLCVCTRSWMCTLNALEWDVTRCLLHAQNKIGKRYVSRYTASSSLPQHMYPATPQRMCVGAAPLLPS